MKIGFIGNGRLCRAFSVYLAGCGLNIIDRLGKKEIYADFPRHLVNTQQLVDFITECEFIFITTPDDSIAAIAEIVSEVGVELSDKIVVHMSGSLSSGEMQSLQGICGGLYSLHPMTSVTGEPLDFSKIIFTLEGSNDAIPREKMLRFLQEANLRYVDITAQNKLLYHAASCICANYTVALIHMAQDIFTDIGFDPKTARELMLPLMKQVMNNVEQTDTKNALTGPVSRGDVGTITKHLGALEAYSKYGDVYRLLGGCTADISSAAGKITPETAADIKRLMAFGGGDS